MLRFIIYLIFFYVIYRFVKGIFLTSDSNKEKKIEKEHKSSFNIDKKDIEDAKFKEIKKDK